MRIEKLREEMEKAWQRAAQWQARARDLEKQVTEQENLQIIQAVRGISASPEELGEVLRRIRARKGLPGPGGKPGREEEDEAGKTESGKGEKDEEKGEE